VSEGPGLLSASARFTVGAQAAPTTVVGVLQTETNFDWTIAVDKRGTTDWTGIAVVNPWDTAVSFTVDFFQNGTRVPGTTTRSFNLNISGHWAKIVNEDAMFLSAWNAFTGVGTLRIRSTGGPVAAMALRGDGPAGLIYSSLPADAGTQRWDFSYTDSTAQTGTWQWQFVDGHTFVGWEVNSFNDFAVRLRGMVDSDFGQFLAEWNYSNSDTTYGVIAFIGTIALEGTTQVITGKRMQLQSDGTVISSVPFRATRVAY
jgi:hypothetical protein